MRWERTSDQPLTTSLPTDAVCLSLCFHDDLERCALLPAPSMCFQLGWSRRAKQKPSTWLLLIQHQLCVQGCTKPAGPSLTVRNSARRAVILFRILCLHTQSQPCSLVAAPLASSQFFAVSWHPQVADLQGLGLPLQALLQFESVLGQQCAESGHVAVTQP